MAEIVYKIGTVDPARPETYQDGDVLQVFNDDRIARRHLRVICFRRGPSGKLPVDGHGLRVDPDGLQRDFLEQTSELRFERVSRTEVKRVTLATSEEALITYRANDLQGRIDHDLRLAKREDVHIGPALFGSPGREVWYGGHTDYARVKLNQLWNMVETRTPLRRSDHTWWPLTDQELRTCLARPIEDLPGDQCCVLASGLKEGAVVLQKRRHFSLWEEFPELRSTRTRSDIKDKSRIIDLRRDMDVVPASSITLQKSLPTPLEVVAAMQRRDDDSREEKIDRYLSSLGESRASLGIS